MLPALAAPVTVGQRFTIGTTLRLLFRPALESNRISKQVVGGKSILPKQAQRVLARLTGPSVAALPLFFLALLVIPALWLFSGTIMAAAAAILTLRVIDSGMLDQVRVTALPNEEIVRGLVGGTLDRLERWRRVATLVVPLVLGVIACSLAPLMMNVGGLARGLSALLVLAALVAGIVGLNVLGTAVGVAAALHGRDFSAAARAGGVMALITAIEVVCGVLAMASGPLALLSAVALMILPYLLAAATMNLSRRLIRQAA